MTFQDAVTLSHYAVYKFLLTIASITPVTVFCCHVLVPAIMMYAPYLNYGRGSLR